MSNDSPTRSPPDSPRANVFPNPPAAVFSLPKYLKSRACVGLHLALLISSLALLGCDSGKWKFAKGSHLLEQGNPEGLELMKSALDFNNPQIELARPLAMELSKRNDPSAITLLDQVLKQEWDKSTVLNILHVKCQSQCDLLLFREALDTYKLILDEKTERNDSEDNTLAYLRALANVEIELAQQNITSAIDNRSAASDWCCGQRLDLCQKTVVASSLLARFFLYETARNPDIETINSAHHRLRNSLDALSEEVNRVDSQLAQLPAESTDECIERKRYVQKSNLAVLLLVRALVNQDLGKHEECNQDHRRARSLSRDFDKLVAHLPSELECMGMLCYFSDYLDTMGFVQTRSPWPEEEPAATSPATFVAGYDEAIRNLSVAIEARRTFLRGLKGEVTNTMIWPFDNRKFEKEILRSEAISLYHRMLAHERKKNSEAAEKDRKAIIRLGYEPNDHLN